jgi:hypothetical protein
VRACCRLACVVLVAVMTASCGYSLSGRGSFLPSHIRVVGIPLFVNNTAIFDVEQVFTDKVRSEFIGRGRYQVLPQEADVDAVLRGAINSITATPASFTADQQATRYVITIVMKVEFFDVRSNKVLWENGAMVFKDEYDLSSTASGNTADVQSFLGASSNALDRVGADLARTVVSAILEAF